MAKLREEFLRLLEEDRDFRYTVLGYLGIEELIKRLNRIEGELAALREDFNRLAEEQVKLREDFNRLAEEQVKLREELAALREDFNRMLERIERMETRLTRVERTLEKLTLDIEEEALEVVSSRLRKMGIEIELKRLVLPELEINIYGATEDLCIIGECSVRLGVRKLREFLRLVEKVKRERPELLRKKVVLVAYVSLALDDTVEEAKKHGVWLLKATKDYTEPKF